jgi:hypothetical protein
MPGGKGGRIWGQVAWHLELLPDGHVYWPIGVGPGVSGIASLLECL